MSMPGDRLVPEPTTGYTLAVDVRTPPSRVWPWLVQMGQGRGGFYTHTWIENVLGARIHNADAIVTEWQELAEGDSVRLTPDPYLGRPGQRMIVEEIRTREALVFRQTLPTGATASWSFRLFELGPDSTRLVMRRRGTHPSLFDRLMAPGYVVMDRGVLSGIRRRAEAHFGRSRRKMARIHPCGFRSP